MNCPNGFLCLQLKDVINFLVLLATIFAIYFGPIRAVEMSRRNNEIREKIRRQTDILTRLMSTRRRTLDPAHVAALNLVELEFYDSDKIREAFRAYIGNIETRLRDNPAKNEVDDFLAKRTDKFIDLVHEISQRLGYSFDKRDLHKLSYTPEGWQNLEFEQQTLRRLAIELLEGTRPISTTPFALKDASKYPPPPTL